MAVLETFGHPYLKSLAHRGYVQGTTLHSKATSQPLCHYFGCVRYALPPPERWRRAQKLPESYSYGTKDQPAPCDQDAAVCPQPSFMGRSYTKGFTEDCFQASVWVPLGEPPKGGKYQGPCTNQLKLIECSYRVAGPFLHPYARAFKTHPLT